MELLKWANKPAREILKELNLTEPPFDPWDIAEKMGVVVKNDLDWNKIDSDGQIYLNSYDLPEIWINPTISHNRQAFTLAHELGHLVYHVLPRIDDFKDLIKDDYSTLFRKNGINSPKETIANKFAGNLLLPVIPLMKFVRKVKMKYQNEITAEMIIDLTSTQFGVSKDSVIVRFKYLGSLPQSYQYPN